VGESVSLASRTSYAFTDGNHHGGVGVVWVTKDGTKAPKVKEVSTSVAAVFTGSTIAGLTSAKAIAEALGRLRNVLAELAGLYHVVATAKPGQAFTLVHDYEGVGAWMVGRWQTKDASVREIIDACRALAAERKLTLTYQHQWGHQSSWVSGNEFAKYNARADALATKGAR